MCQLTVIFGVTSSLTFTWSSLKETLLPETRSTDTGLLQVPYGATSGWELMFVSIRWRFVFAEGEGQLKSKIAGRETYKLARKVFRSTEYLGSGGCASYLAPLLLYTCPNRQEAEISSFHPSFGNEIPKGSCLIAFTSTFRLLIPFVHGGLIWQAQPLGIISKRRC